MATTKHLDNIKLPDSNASHFLKIKEGSNLTADRTLTILTGDLDRTLDLTINSLMPGGRLSLSSGVPFNTSELTAQTTVYYVPYLHNCISLWDGSGWTVNAFTELTLALGTLTSGKNYDVFCYLSSGTPTLESLVWTNDTTRATAVTVQDGRYCKNGDKTRLLLGTFRTTSTTTTEDSYAKRFLSNLYHAAPRGLFICPGYVDDNTATTYTTNSTTFTEVNGGTNSRVQWVSCLAGSVANISGVFAVNASATGSAYFGIQMDGNTSPVVAGQAITSAVVRGIATQYVFQIIGEGYHYVAQLWCSTAGTATGVADVVRSGAGADPAITYLTGWVDG